MPAWLKAKMLAFQMIIDYEENEQFIELCKIIAGVPRLQ